MPINVWFNYFTITFLSLFFTSACGEVGFTGLQQKQKPPSPTATGDAQGATEEIPEETPDPCSEQTPEQCEPLKPETLIQTASESPAAPQFSLLVNDPTCSFCHMTVRGDVVSTRTVEPIWQFSNLDLKGHWYAAKQFAADDEKYIVGVGGNKFPNEHSWKNKECRLEYTWGGNGPCLVPGNFARGVSIKSQGIHEMAATSDKMPNDLNKDGSPDFPKLDMQSLEQSMDGHIEFPQGTIIRGTQDGNLVLTGTKENPIIIRGEVFVKGDLVIKGFYRGIGNIYASGNIYIPGDLRASKSAFPFSEDKHEALDQAKKMVTACAIGSNAYGKNPDCADALSLATPKSILISDLDSHGTNNYSPYAADHWAVPTNRSFEALDVLHLFTWFKKADYDKLYEGNPVTSSNTRFDCIENNHYPLNNRTFSLIEAFLYAGNTIGGRANHNGYAINGGIIADHFHILSSASHCPNVNHPVHGYNAKTDHINFDYRMQAGLMLLRQLEAYFEK